LIINRELSVVKKSLSVKAFTFFRMVCATVLIMLSAASLAGCNQLSGFTNNATDTTTVISTTQTTLTPATTTTAIPTSGWCNSEAGLRVRSGPGTDYNGIGGLYYAEEVTILGKEGDWYEILFADGTAYASALYIQSTPVTEATTTAEVLTESTTEIPTETTTAE
jgi:uncharacterized protein YgiM (DUF1202 family)